MVESSSFVSILLKAANHHQEEACEIYKIALTKSEATKM